MPACLFIQRHNPFTEDQVEYQYQLAQRLPQVGNSVIIRSMTVCFRSLQHADHRYRIISMRVMKVIDQGFRTTTEEQDGAILRLRCSMEGAGADLVLLLRGYAVHYATLKQRQPRLPLEGWGQSRPANLTQDLSGLLQKGVPIYMARDNLVGRDLKNRSLLKGVTTVEWANLYNLNGKADEVWQW